MNVRRALAISLATLLTSATLSLAQVSGTVKLDGSAPEPKAIDLSNSPDCAKMHADPLMDETVVVDDKGNLQNVVVSIKAADGQDLGGEAPAKPVELDQQGCAYSPHVVAMMTGQTLVVKNSDDLMHNVHSITDANPPTNQAQLKDPKGLEIKDLKAAETFMIKCDVHPWMKAWVSVIDHPFFAVSKEDGTFTFDTKGLKDGDYTLQAWHEKFGTMTQKISVKGGKAMADFKFSQEKKADAGTAKAVLASAKVEDMACCKVTRASLAAKTN